MPKRSSSFFGQHTVKRRKRTNGSGKKNARITSAVSKRTIWLVLQTVQPNKV